MSRRLDGGSDDTGGSRVVGRGMKHRSVRSVLAGRGFMLLPAAAFGVHQLRYELAYGSRAGYELSAQGHGYLDSLAPWVSVLVAFGAGSFLVHVTRTVSGSDTAGPRRGFGRLWLLSSVALVSVYAVQEWLEGMFAAGHPGGLEGIFGHGGWWAVPLSAAFGLAVAALLWLASAVVEAIEQLGAARPVLAGRLRLPRPDSVFGRRPAPLASSSAGRAPPRAGVAVAF
jgi:hypothetical protein